MGRLNITHLPRPELAYNISRLAPPPGHGSFETPEFARKEDAGRVKSLTANASAAPLLYRADQAHRLAAKLDQCTLDMARTAASSLHMGYFRLCLVGAVWQLIAESTQWRLDEVVFFTVRPAEWELTPAQLPQVPAARLMAQLRTRLNRAGAADADGWLIAFLHGEFEPTSGMYVLHAHGFAVGGMVEVLERLRGTKTAPGWLYGRLNRSRKPITDLAYLISYGFKSFWPSRRIGPVGEAGEIKRRRDGQRIPEPYHSQYLIWLDQQPLAGLGLLMKLTVTRSGLQLTTP